MNIYIDIYMCLCIVYTCACVYKIKIFDKKSRNIEWGVEGVKGFRLFVLLGGVRTRVVSFVVVTEGLLKNLLLLI